MREIDENGWKCEESRVGGERSRRKRKNREIGREENADGRPIFIKIDRIGRPYSAIGRPMEHIRSAEGKDRSTDGR